MALIKCPECGREISNAAAACPHCGFPLRQQKVDNVKQEENAILSRNADSQKKTDDAQKEHEKRPGCLISVAVVVFILIAMLIATSIGNEEKRLKNEQMAAREPEPAYASSASASAENRSTTEKTLSLDDLTTEMRRILRSNYDHCSVGIDGDTIVVNLWNDGVATGIYMIQQGQLDIEEWTNIKTSLKKLSNSMKKTMSAAGQKDAHLIINVLNDENTDKTLLTLYDSTVTFDVLS